MLSKSQVNVLQVDPLLLESERDFLVVASLGAQKVGRSTVRYA
jgi:hypothetical protein